MDISISKRTLTIASAIVIVAAAAGGWMLFTRDVQESPRNARAGAPRSVVAAVVQKEEFSDRLEAIGTLFANESVNVTAKTQGIIRSIEDGRTIKQGEQIAAIDAGEQDAQLNVELANLEQQRKELERTMGLAKDSHVSQARVDEQVALLKKAEANVSAARVRSGDRRIVAPFSGIVGTRRISVGALVTPGTLITTLDDISQVKLDFAIPETFMATLQPGLDIEASASAYPKEIFKGKVMSVDSRVDPVTRSVSIRAVIDNADLRLRPGMLMVVQLIKDKRDSLMIPEAALLPENDQQYVFTIGPDSVVTRLKVVIRRRRAGSVEVLDGLHDGDFVVKEGLQDLRSGDKVTVLNTKDLPQAPPRASGPAVPPG